MGDINNDSGSFSTRRLLLLALGMLLSIMGRLLLCVSCSVYGVSLMVGFTTAPTRSRLL